MSGEAPGGPVLPAVGFDVGARRLHGIRLERGRRGLVVVDRLRTDRAADPAAAAAGVADGLVAAAVAFGQGAARVAVDGPGGPSAGAHLGDDTVAPKFRSGRCSEIPVRGVPAVSWVTPIDAGAAPGWMRTSFALWAALVSTGRPVVETFPAAVFHRLNGGRWPPPKTTPAGRARRLELLGQVMTLPAGAGEWGHDDIDAAAAAYVAATGAPVAHACPTPDGSALWLPAS